MNQQTILSDGNGTLPLSAGDEFHVYMRDWVIGITFFAILWIISYFIISAFVKAKDKTNHVLSILLCIACLTISLAALLLLPITILSNEIIYNFPNYYYTQWLHRELIFTLWNKIFWSANIALFIILPFSHFFHQAYGWGGEGILARLKEASFVLLLFSLLIGAFVYLVRGLLSEEESVGYLPFSYSIMSSVGALLVLLSTPRGFTTLTTFGMRLYVPVVSRTYMEERLRAFDMDEQVILARINETRRASPEDTAELASVRAARASFMNSTLHPILRNIFSIVVTVVNLLFTGYLVLRVLFIHVLRPFFSPLFGDPTTSELADFLALQDDAKAHRLGSFAALLQIIVIFYMMTSAFVGFYYLPITKRIQPHLRGMSIEKLTLNVAVVLLISSSFPVVARILEITSFDLLGDYSNTTYLRSQQFLIGYRIIFLVALTHRWVTFINDYLHDLVVKFMTPILVKCKARFEHLNISRFLAVFNPKPKDD